MWDRVMCYVNLVFGVANLACAWVMGVNGIPLFWVNGLIGLVNIWAAYWYASKGQR